MQAKAIRWFSLGLIVIVTVASSVDGYETPGEGAYLPDFELEVPQSQTARQYLGLSGEGRFRISQIMADFVIMEIFSMYCPHCQREAPTMNAFYHRIESSPKLRDRVKLIGIGVGNSPLEVDFFREQYNVPFPLFADGDFAIHKLIGEVRTPYFFGVAITPDGSQRIFFSGLGGAKDAQALLDEMIQKTGLE